MKDYENGARDSSASAEVKNIISPLLARQQAPIRQLDRLIKAT